MYQNRYLANVAINNRHSEFSFICWYGPFGKGCGRIFFCFNFWIFTRGSQCTCCKPKSWGWLLKSEQKCDFCVTVRSSLTSTLKPRLPCSWPPGIWLSLQWTNTDAVKSGWMSFRTALPMSLYFHFFGRKYSDVPLPSECGVLDLSVPGSSRVFMVFFGCRVVRLWPPT